MWPIAPRRWPLLRRAHPCLIRGWIWLSTRPLSQALLGRAGSCCCGRPVCLDSPKAAALIICAVSPDGRPHRALRLAVAMLSPVKHLASCGRLLDHVLMCWPRAQPPRVGVNHVRPPNAEEIRRRWLLLGWVIVLILVLRCAVPRVPGPVDVPALH